jgi:hypothetical protein
LLNTLITVYFQRWPALRNTYAVLLRMVIFALIPVIGFCGE